jgi:exonuclease SbcD
VVIKNLPWPAIVHRFGTRAAQTFRLEHLGVALRGWSFAHQAAPDNLALRYPDAEPGLFNIGVLHLLSGRAGHARYAPCETADLKAWGYDYWATLTVEISASWVRRSAERACGARSRR